MRDGGREGCLRVLGLGAGASEQEIKAAYRDLAKVWHPDRFSHDPRLQQKAQEQLKEINEAYRRLVSGDFAATTNSRARRDTHATQGSPPPRATHTPPRTTASDAARHGTNEAPAAAERDERVATRPRRSVSRVAIAAPALAFCATFAFFTPRLLSTNRAPERPSDAALAAPARDEHDEPTGRPAESEATEANDARAQQKNQTTARQQSKEAAESSMPATAAQPVRAMPTVTVSIDPTTGLRARPSCPHKTAMTFPAGDEPAGYCDAAHASPQRAAADEARAGKNDEPRGKSLAGRLASPVKKLFGGGSSDKKAAREGDATPRN